MDITQIVTQPCISLQRKRFAGSPSVEHFKFVNSTILSAKVFVECGVRSQHAPRFFDVPFWP